MQCSLKRKIPSIVIKPDLAKAFDTINWNGLIRTLQARGFNNTWCDWIVDASKSVLVPICRLGKWQSRTMDHMQARTQARRPALTILISPTTSRPKRRNTWSGKKSMSSDTLIIVLRGDVSDISELKSTLQRFAEAMLDCISTTRRAPRFRYVSKILKSSQFLPILGCRQEGFPHDYLGLPLSPSRRQVKATGFSIHAVHTEDRSPSGMIEGCSTQHHGAGCAS